MFLKSIRIWCDGIAYFGQWISEFGGDDDYNNNYVLDKAGRTLFHARTLDPPSGGVVGGHRHRHVFPSPIRRSMTIRSNFGVIERRRSCTICFSPLQYVFTYKIRTSCFVVSLLFPQLNLSNEKRFHYAFSIRCISIHVVYIHF